ncbi:MULTISPECIES: hypothetical protein [Burkholderia]|uniref:hypothetical protein n=1 Tax=Burkholderia TaxID=32008 RepID=UPI0012BD4EF3|nr:MULTISPECIES: hypothetical protein [Burkholderia]
MSQVSSASRPTVCEDWSHFLPGFTLTHTVHLVSRRIPGIVSTAEAVLEGETATVDRWAITRCGDVLEQKIVLGEMTEGQAVRLRERLAALEGVLRARVGHHFVRGGSATAGNASESQHTKANAAVTNQAAFRERTREQWNYREKTCHDRECLVRWYADQKNALSEIATTGVVGS